MNRPKAKELTFWDHLDELRKVLFHILLVVGVFTIAAFLAKDIMFNIVLAPSYSDFVLYRFFCYLATTFSFPSLCPEPFQTNLISIQLASQFLIHMSVSFYVGIVLASPYIIYRLFCFISPALYEKERKYSARIIFFSSLLFLIGMLLCYFLIFPLSFRFLATYQVSADIPNTITLSSYINTFLMLMLMMGIVFEIPILCWFFAKLGFLTSPYMKKYRRHAIVLILVIAAIITPTTDIFTLLLVSIPMYLLYELSILIVKKSTPKPAEIEDEIWESPYEE